MHDIFPSLRLLMMRLVVHVAVNVVNVVGVAVAPAADDAVVVVVVFVALLVVVVVLVVNLLLA